MTGAVAERALTSLSRRADLFAAEVTSQHCGRVAFVRSSMVNLPQSSGVAETAEEALMISVAETCLGWHLCCQCRFVCCHWSTRPASVELVTANGRIRAARGWTFGRWSDDGLLLAVTSPCLCPFRDPALYLQLAHGPCPCPCLYPYLCPCLCFYLDHDLDHVPCLCLCRGLFLDRAAVASHRTFVIGGRQVVCPARASFVLLDGLRHDR